MASFRFQAQRAQIDLDDADETSTTGSGEDDASETFNAMLKKARMKMSDSFRSGRPEEAKSFAFQFAASSIKSGFWNKSEKALVLPMLKAAEASAKRPAPDKAAPNSDKNAMVKGRNGADLPAAAVQLDLFQTRMKGVRKLFAQQKGAAIHTEVD